MDLVLAIAVCLAGGLMGGLVGVGGGVLFVPAMTVFLAMDQVEAEATSLLIIAIVALVGTWRQSGYGNVNLRDGLLIGLLSPVGVVIGVVLANNVPERALEVAFAALALLVAFQLFRRAFGGPDDGLEAGEEAG
jgi:uncharacterized membrane protein YfcA